MSSRQKLSSLGCFARSIYIGGSCILFLLFLLGLVFVVATAYVDVQFAHLSQSGVQTQAIVVDAETTKCGKNSLSVGYNYTLRFTDSVGHEETATLDCEYGKVSRGSSITIVYLPSDPTIIALPSDIGNLPIATVAVSIFFGVVDLLMLVCFIFWLRNGKELMAATTRRRRPAVSRQPRMSDQARGFSSNSGALGAGDGSHSDTLPRDLRHYWTQEQPASPSTSQPDSEFVDYFQPTDPPLFDTQHEQTGPP